MGTIIINGTELSPQPAQVDWLIPVNGSKLNGTEAEAAFGVLVLSAPKMKNATFNWASFENSVLSSIVAPSPGTDAESNSYTTYNSGVISRKIKSFSVPNDRTVTGVSLEILIVL